MNSQLTRPARIWLTLAIASTPALAQTQPPPRPNVSIAPLNGIVKPPAPAPLPPQPELVRTPSATARPQFARAKPASTGAPQFKLQVDHSRMYFDTDAAGAIWARGAGYKARLDERGAEFAPFFGSDAPRNFPVSLALASVSCGGNALELDTHATPTRADTVVTFDRGDVSEVFELTPASVEQKFVLASLPGSGDVHLRVAYSSELVATHAEDGFRFENEYGYVHYGNATAIDALGHTLALHSELDGGAIAIEVPADFVARATLPLVIDPLISVFQAESGPQNPLNPDVAYDDIGFFALHCWEEVFSAGDSDVFTELMDPYGNLSPGGTGYVDYTYENWVRPRCAYQLDSGRYLIAAQVGAPGNRNIKGRIRNADFSFWSQPLMLSDTGYAGEKLNCDVGGDPYPSTAAYFLVVYERALSSTDRDIHARLIDRDGTPLTTVLIDDSAGTTDSMPSVSKTDDYWVWNVAWQREAWPGNHNIYGARVTWSGGINTPTFPVASNFRDETNPSVSGSIHGSNRFVVAHELDYGTDHDIVITLFDDSALLSALDLSAAEGSYYLQDQLRPALECDGAHFACMYSENWQQSTTNYDALIVEFGVSDFDFTIDEPHNYLTNWGYTHVEYTIASKRSSNPNPWTNPPAAYVLTFTWYSATTAYLDDLLGGTYMGTIGGQIYSFCEGTPSTCPCGNSQGSGSGCSNSANVAGAWLAASGSPCTSSDNLTMQYGAMPAGVSALLFQSLNAINNGAGNPFGDGIRCVGTPAFRYPIRTTDIYGFAQYGYNSSDIPVSVRGGVPYLGATVLYQVWYRDGATYCTPAGTNFTNALQVYWTP